MKRMSKACMVVTGANKRTMSVRDSDCAMACGRVSRQYGTTSSAPPTHPELGAQDRERLENFLFRLLRDAGGDKNRRARRDQLMAPVSPRAAWYYVRTSYPSTARAVRSP